MNKKDLVPGTLYIIKDSFFRKVKDPYLMKNRKGRGIRPEIFLFVEISNGLALMAPVTSKANKYDSIIKKLNKELNSTNDVNKKEEINNKLLGYYKSTLNGVSGYILLQDMFMVDIDYIKREYTSHDGIPVSLDSSKVENLISQAKKVYDLLRGGFRFMSTQLDFARIEKMMTLESKNDK